MDINTPAQDSLLPVIDEDYARIFYIYAEAPRIVTDSLAQIGLHSNSRFGYHLTIFRLYQCLSHPAEAKAMISALALETPRFQCRFTRTDMFGKDTKKLGILLESNELMSFYERLAIRLLIGGSTHTSTYFGRNYNPHIAVGSNTEIVRGVLEELVGKEFEVSKINFAFKRNAVWMQEEETRFYLTG